MFNNRVTPLGFILWCGFFCPDFIREPDLSDQSLQIQSFLCVEFLVFVDVIERGGYSVVFLNQGTSGDFGRVCSKNKIASHTDNSFNDTLLIDPFIDQASEQFFQLRTNGSFSRLRLFGNIGEIKKLVERSCDGY